MERLLSQMQNIQSTFENKDVEAKKQLIREKEELRV